MYMFYNIHLFCYINIFYKTYDNNNMIKIYKYGHSGINELEIIHKFKTFYTCLILLLYTTSYIFTHVQNCTRFCVLF